MYFQLSSALKRRLIEELRKYWAYHPKYPELPGNIQGKYRFSERPQYGMTIKTVGGNRADFSADNFKGIQESFVYLTKYINYPGVAIEWVREDAVAIQNNRGLFPSSPGVYFIELTSDTEFCVDPLLDIYREEVAMSSLTSGMLQNAPLSGTVRLYEMPSGFKLKEDVNYTLGRDSEGRLTGEIELTYPLSGGRTLVADYRYPAETRGPFALYPMQADNHAIPGVVLAFGNKNKAGDRMAVVVQDFRRPAALVYGGQWDVNLEIEVISRDLEAQMELADATAIYIWGILRPKLSSEGIEISDLSLGSESEEPYDENGDDYFYNAIMSLTVRTDWEVYVPLNILIRQTATLTKDQAELVLGLSEDQLIDFQNNLHMVETLGLEAMQDPFFKDRSNTYEVIK